MSERRFLLHEVDETAKYSYSGLITESELKRRLLVLMDIEECKNWPLAIDTLLHGEKEQHATYDGKYPIDFNDPQPDVWDAWLARCPSMYLREWFSTIPCRLACLEAKKEKP
jgi:hypothetical protein